MRDFHGAQDQARRQSRRLIWMFIAATALLLLLTNVVVALAFIGFDQSLFESWNRVVQAPDRLGMQQATILWKAYLTGPLFPVVSLVVLGGVGLATLFKASQLSAGGHKVAQMLGGTRLLPDDDNPRHRKLLNVVEEMAIASGTPVPAVYLMPDDSINAFAAGFSSDDAVIGTTRGAVERLTRDELQGVIAHEFSHILNGDMRLNMRMIAALGGIVFIATAGRILMHASGGRRGRGSKDAMPIVLLGLVLVALGWIGVFCGRIIKASLSRQREYLADASAVQFTRNPTGLAGALKKIAGVGSHGRIGSPRAEEVSHLFFAQAVSAGLAGLFATHPPLDDRIRRLDPQWDGEVAEATAIPLADDEATHSALSAGGATVAAGVIDSVAPEPLPAMTPELLALVRSQQGAAVAVIACLARFDDQVLETAAALAPALATPLRENAGLIRHLDASLLVPMLELSMPALGTLDEARAAALRQLLQRLYEQDGRLDLVEIVIASMLERHLPGGQFRPRDALPRFRNLDDVRAALAVVLGALAAGNVGELAPGQLDAVNTALGGAIGRPFERGELTGQNIGWSPVAAALVRLRKLYPLRKPPVMKAFAALLEGQAGEAGLSRATLQLLAAAIDCPWSGEAPQG